MSYREKILKYSILVCIFMAIWYWFERVFLYEAEACDLLPLVVGTHGGYGFFLLISSVFMLVFLLLLEKEINPFSLTLLSRLQRKYALKKMLLGIIENGLLYTSVYVMVQIVCVCINIDIERLVEADFFAVMAMYYIAVLNIFVFGGMCYLLMNTIFKNSYVAMIITVAINMYISYFFKSELLYGGLTVVDDMTRGIQIQWFMWSISQMINVCITAVLYVVCEELYRKKDII